GRFASLRYSDSGVSRSANDSRTSGMRLYPCAASARNSASVMMLQRYSQGMQRKAGRRLARDAGAAYEGRRQRQSPPRTRITGGWPLRLKALNIIAAGAVG